MATNWWTPPRVTTWLLSYPDLAYAVHMGCAVDYTEEGVGGSDGNQDGIGLHLLTILVDLDRALAILPNGTGRGLLRQMEKTARMAWCEGMTQEAIAEELHMSERHVRRKLAEAKRRIIGFLCAA